MVGVPDARALDIVPIFQNSAGETWDATRQGVIQQAIGDWEARVGGSEVVTVTFDFANAGASYVAQWEGDYVLALGTDVRPWTSGVDHEVHFNADLFDPAGPSNPYPGYSIWWDDTPGGPDETVPFMGFDALTYTRHEIGHMLGFVGGFYVDDFATGSQVDLWSSHITIEGSLAVFDSGGLDVVMNSPADYAHLANAGGTAGDLMNYAFTNGSRHDITDTDLGMLAMAYGMALIPEPSSLACVVLGLAGIFGRRRRAS